MSPAGRSVQTAPEDADPRLRGRTYAVPFEQVWQASHALAKGGLRGWHILEADDYDGIIKAEAHSLIFRSIHDVEITIKLDENAQTRVDLAVSMKKGMADLGASVRRIEKFLHRLDLTLAKNRQQRLAAERKS